MSKVIKVPWLPFGWDGLAVKPFIFMKDTTDLTLLQHENVHIRQQERLGLMYYLFKYATSKAFRYEMEIEAYVKGSKMGLREAHDFVTKRYKR